MQKYLDFKGEPFQEGREESSDRPSTGNSQNCIARKQDLLRKEDNLHMKSNGNGFIKPKLE